LSSDALDSLGEFKLWVGLFRLWLGRRGWLFCCFGLRGGFFLLRRSFLFLGWRGFGCLGVDFVPGDLESVGAVNGSVATVVDCAAASWSPLGGSMETVGSVEAPSEADRSAGAGVVVPSMLTDIVLLRFWVG